jgi:hypothetical protein
MGWSFAGLLLLLPLVAMQFTEEVNWDETDFIVMGALIGAVGLGIEYFVRTSTSLAYRFGAAVALLAVLLTIWVNLAVGMIGSEDNPYNLLFGGVILLAIFGASILRFSPCGMAGVMLVAGIVQIAVSAAGLSLDWRGGVFSLFFALPWWVSAGLFRLSARSESV